MVQSWFWAKSVRPCPKAEKGWEYDSSGRVQTKIQKIKQNKKNPWLTKK
jgi:hypothetical protein